MISGAYSNKYKAAQNEHIQRLKEQAKTEGQTIKDRVKELSKETNRRRKALEDKKKQLEEEEERKRETVLFERRKEKEEATQKFQKDHTRKKARPSSGKASRQTESPQLLQDGLRIVRGHVVEIKNGEQITVPTLEDALDMVNIPYTMPSDHIINYNGPAELYNDIVYTQTGPQNMNGSVYQDDPFDEQVKLRENALQNGGPKYAFVSNWCTDGALPQTMGRNSPSGSLTSLDSLDEVPFDCLPGQDRAPTGIIAKDKARSAERRRVTFSDSIEFDDGLTGQLDTAEKESCKQYVKQYNSRLAASNAAYSAGLNATKPSNVKSINSSPSARVLGTPGSTPARKGELPTSVATPSSGSASMVIPMSMYSQFTGNKPVVSTGEATRSSDTHSDHPIQCVAEVESRHSTASNETCNEYRGKDSDTGEGPIPLHLDDSLDNFRDSLEIDANKSLHQQNELQSNEVINNETEPIHSTLSDSNHGDGNHGNQESVPVDYYGNPTTIYHHPFGARNISQDGNEMLNMEQEPTSYPNYGYTSELLLLPAGQTTAGSGADKQGQGDVTHAKSPTNEKNDHISNSSPSSSEIKLVTKGSPNSSYYKSWYAGSFFNSKTYFGEEDDSTDKQDKIVKKNNSVAYDLIDNEQNVPTYIPKQKSVADTRSNTNRSCKESNATGVSNSGRTNPLRNPKSDINGVYDREVNSTNNQSKNKTNSPVSKHDTRANRMTAKPPHPSTRHKGIVYSSPLHRKRAAVAARGTTGKNSPRTAPRRSPAKAKEITAKKNTENEKKVNRVGSATSRGSSQVGYTRGNSSSSSEEDEMLQNIRRDMDRISMLSNASPAQEEHQKILNNINSANSPLLEVPPKSEQPHKTDFRSVYKKVHKPRVGSAKQGAQLVSSNRGQPSKIPVYTGPSGLNYNQGGNYDQTNNKDNVAVPYNTSPKLASGQDGSNWTQNSRQGSRMDTNELIHLQTAALKQSISLDKTPTDDEINILWDRVRNCLNNKETQSVGSDSCVNKVDVRRSRAHTGPFVTHEDNPLRDSALSHTGRAASIAGMGNIGGLRRYGSQEVLRRYGSADNIGPYRQQPLLQHRAQRTRQSSQGKPPMQPRQPMNFSPMSSRQAPAVSMSTRAGAVPLTQHEIRAVMKASLQTQEHRHRTQQEQTPEHGHGYHTGTSTRTGPSALSIEEHKLLQSLDRLNDRLKVQEAMHANINTRPETNVSAKNTRPSNHQRTSSATYRYNTR